MVVLDDLQRESAFRVLCVAAAERNAEVDGGHRPGRAGDYAVRTVRNVHDLLQLAHRVGPLHERGSVTLRPVEAKLLSGVAGDLDVLCGEALKHAGFVDAARWVWLRNACVAVLGERVAA